MTTPARNRYVVVACVSYAVLALAWIFLSDRLLSTFADMESIVSLSTAKGVFFVCASTTAFFFALRSVPAADATGMGRLMDALATGVAPGRRPRWLTWFFAVTITLAMLLVRQRLSVGFGDPPLLIVFMFPIILSALLGGLGPGLVSTAMAALAVDYLAIAPQHSLRIANSVDLLQLAFLVVNGVAVSVLSEMLRRSLIRAELDRRLLDAVISSTPDAVFVKDTEARYLLANAAACALAGKAREEIIGRDDSVLFPEATAREMMAMDRAILATGRTHTTEELVTTHTGRTRVFLGTRGPVIGEAGRVVGLFGIARDITEHRSAEAELRKLNTGLEQRVAERTAELQSANTELEDLAYALTHNLRAPLRAISGFSQVLVEDHAGTLDTEARKCLAQITQASGDMGELIDGILALLRCTRGELKRETVDISVLAGRRLGKLAHGEPLRQIVWDVEPGLSATGDTEMLDVVMAHLLDNAWKFTRGTTQPVIRVFAGQVDAVAGICVSDNGAGFDMAHANRLFNAFQRMHRQDEFPGTGIGLATVQRIIRRHGGEIRAEAVPGAGATFCFSLPAGNGGNGGSS
ncbi:sensor histidine kinase [Aromatoleum diolicum]|uniref:histidine kinase n=1 Tax=Aromatoleum diolicum TaxID=75796 RepID=A0ABX1QBC3_9RHOO|nr:PAS domain-containing protein [Aromatoleum diolicum]NMG74716.1 PAS domain-containing protein [Aromatoleum diolicum]